MRTHEQQVLLFSQAQSAYEVAQIDRNRRILSDVMTHLDMNIYGGEYGQAVRIAEKAGLTGTAAVGAAGIAGIATARGLGKLFQSVKQFVGGKNLLRRVIPRPRR